MMGLMYAHTNHHNGYDKQALGIIIKKNFLENKPANIRKQQEHLWDHRNRCQQRTLIIKFQSSF